MKITKKSSFSHRCFKAADYLDSVSEDDYGRKITRKLAAMRQQGMKRPKSSEVIGMMHDQAQRKLSCCINLKVATPYVRDVTSSGKSWLDGKEGREFVWELCDEFHSCKRRKGAVYLKRN